jgi:hypothetical protein
LKVFNISQFTSLLTLANAFPLSMI